MLVLTDVNKHEGAGDIHQTLTKNQGQLLLKPGILITSTLGACAINIHIL